MEKKGSVLKEEENRPCLVKKSDVDRFSIMPILQNEIGKKSRKYDVEKKSAFFPIHQVKV